MKSLPEIKDFLESLFWDAVGEQAEGEPSDAYEYACEAVDTWISKHSKSIPGLIDPSTHEMNDDALENLISDLPSEEDFLNELGFGEEDI